MRSYHHLKLEPINKAQYGLSEPCLKVRVDVSIGLVEKYDALWSLLNLPDCRDAQNVQTDCK